MINQAEHDRLLGPTDEVVHRGFQNGLWTNLSSQEWVSKGHSHTHTHSYCMVEWMNFMFNYETFYFFLNWFSAQWDSCEMGHNAILLDDGTSSNYVFVMTGSDCKSAIKSKITERIPTETNLFGDFCVITNSLCQTHHTPLAETARVIMKHTSFKPDRIKIKLGNLPARVFTVLTSTKSDVVELDPHFTALDVSERQAALYRNVLANWWLICIWNIVVDGKCSALTAFGDSLWFYWQQNHLPYISPCISSRHSQITISMAEQSCLW